MSVDDRPYAPQPPGVMTPQEAKAHAKAANAYAKATRPLYKKKRVIVPSVFAAIVLLIAITSSGGDSSAPTGQDVAAEAPS